MKLGLHLPETTWQGGAPGLRSTLRDVVQEAEAAGFDAIAVADHVWLHPIMGGPEQHHLEAYTTLGLPRRPDRACAAPGDGHRSVLSTRRPLAKIVSTLDVLSGGRAMLGIGSGDYAEEAEGLGLPFPAAAGIDSTSSTRRSGPASRCGPANGGASGPSRAGTSGFGRALNLPQSLSRPHPPILIAGSGEKRTLPLVVRYGDACNISPTPELPRKIDLLRRLCDEAGRDYDSIEKTVPSASTWESGREGRRGDRAIAAGSRASASTPSSAGSSASIASPPRGHEP